MKTLTLFFLAITVGLSQGASTDDIQKEWMKTFNQKSIENLLSFYHNNAGQFSNGILSLVQDEGATILGQLKEKVKRMDAYETVYYTEGRQGNVMSIGYLRVGDSLLASLVGWRKQGDKFMKEFETILPIEPQKAVLPTEALDRQRRNWEKYSNAHDPAGLIENVYSTASYYFNQGRIDQGRPAITTRYGYMKNENWNIRLEAKGLLPVTKNLIFEIGKYYSTGEGQYLLIWEKVESGEWQVKLDFNF